MSGVTALHARTLSQREKFTSTTPVFFTPGRVSTLTHLLGAMGSSNVVNTSDDRINYEWNQRVMSVSTSYTPNPLTTWYVPGHYTDPMTSDTVNAQIIADARAAVSLALRYLVLDDAAAASGAANILSAWTRYTLGSGADSELVWCYRWPVFLQAAMMLRGASAYTAPLHSAMQSITLSGIEQMSTAYTKTNNWANWGVVAEIASAVFLEDRTRFDRALFRWRDLFDEQVVSNVPVYEIYRQEGGTGNGSTGLWYCKFLILAMTCGAEWARYAGEWLYDYQGHDGSTFKTLYEQVRYWTRHPGEYPYNSSGTPSVTTRILAHDDVLQALWPSEDEEWLLENFATPDDRDTFGMYLAPLAYRYRPLYG